MYIGNDIFRSLLIVMMVRSGDGGHDRDVIGDKMIIMAVIFEHYDDMNINSSASSSKMLTSHC
jgi:hypothetical protein